MRSPLRRAASALLALLACASSASAAAGKGRLAAWVVRDQLTSPESVAEVVKEARAAGIDTLIVQVRGRGDAYYKTDLAPRAEALAGAPEGFDPLAEVLKRAKGLRVLAWLNVYYLWGGQKPPLDDSHPAAAYEDWLLEDRDGRSVKGYSAQDRALGWIEGVYADPASPEYRALFVRVAAEVARKYRVDGIHLDFVRYPGSGYGQGSPLGDEFERTWGFDPRWLPQEAESVGPATLLGGSLRPSARVLATASLLWKDLRAEQVTQLVREVRHELRAGPRRVELSVAVFPKPGEAYLDKGQDWLTWASQGLVDALFPMTYFGGADRVGAQLAEMAKVLRSRAPAVRLWAGLGGYLKEPAQIAEEARTAWALGCQGVCLFDLGTLRKKPGGARPYAEAVGRGRPVSRAKLAPVPRPPANAGGASPLVAALDRAAGGRIAWTSKEKGRAEALWEDLQAARSRAIPDVLDELSASAGREPEWADLRGVFRYLSSQDGDGRKLSQRHAVEAALARLQAGEDVAAVAKEVSQWPNRSVGGALERRYLDPGDATGRLLSSLAPGELSPVVESDAGYWIYVLDAKGGGELRPVAEMAWPARRILFRGALAAELDGEARASGIPSPDAASALPQ